MTAVIQTKSNPWNCSKSKWSRAVGLIYYCTACHSFAASCHDYLKLRSWYPYQDNLDSGIYLSLTYIATGASSEMQVAWDMLLEHTTLKNAQLHTIIKPDTDLLDSLQNAVK